MGWVEDAWENVIVKPTQDVLYYGTGVGIAPVYAAGGLINELTGGDTATYNIFEARSSKGHAAAWTGQSPQDPEEISFFTRAAAAPIAYPIERVIDPEAAGQYFRRLRDAPGKPEVPDWLPDWLKWAGVAAAAVAGFLVLKD